VDQANFNWPMWGQHFQTHGTAGEAPDLPQAQELLALHADWTHSATTEEREAIWRKMLAIHADQVFAIGLISAAPQPIAVSKRLRNVPASAIYAWDPGAHLGVHRIDEFYFAD
jgi:peptide/nickel transport system substrate-binding protein